MKDCDSCDVDVNQQSMSDFAYGDWIRASPLKQTRSVVDNGRAQGRGAGRSRFRAAG